MFRTRIPISDRFRHGSGGGISGVPTQYSVSIAATQVVFAGGRIISNIRAATFTRDSSYFAFRNAIDLVVATVKQQFYQVLLNRELINVQESSVNLLKSQLQDQQNRFEAGTVPRFNVLQAQVALSNQYPLLIAAQNNYRISVLQLAKTLGLDFDPMRAGEPPLEAVGTLQFHPRHIPLPMAIELAKDRRPFLKQQKAIVLSNAAQVNVARAGYFPQFSVSAGEEFRSSPISENINAVRSAVRFQRHRELGDLGLGRDLRRGQASKSGPRAIEDHATTIPIGRWSWKCSNRIPT